MNRRPGTVLFLSHDASHTGAPIFLLRVLRWLREHRDIEFHILQGRAGELSSEFARLATVHSFQPEPTVLYRALRRFDLHKAHLSNHLSRLRKRLSEADIRLIYVNSVASAEMLGFLSFLDCPVICHVHELGGAIAFLSAETGVQVVDTLEKRSPRYIAVSSAVEHCLVGHGIPSSRVQVIHGFIPIPARAQRVVNARETIRRDLGIPREAKIVCGCGSIEPRKGTDIFVEVAVQVRRDDAAAPVHFVWVGGDPEQVYKMRRLNEVSRISDFVHFVGHQRDVAAYFDAADLFLLASREDPFPLVMLEAALSGTPTVCLDQSGGAPEFVGEDAGFVAKDVGEMSDRVRDLLSSPGLCARLGEAARQKVLAHHDLAMGAARIASLIEDALLQPRAMA